MPPEKERRLILENSKLLRKNVELQKENKELKNNQSINLPMLLAEIQASNNQQLIDLKNFISVVNHYALNDIESRSFFVKVCNSLENIFSCKITMYITNNGFIDTKNIKSINDLKISFTKVYGEDNIFEIYDKLNLLDISTIKDLSSYEKRYDWIGDLSVGVYLINGFQQVEGFIFFNSYVTINRIFLEIVVAYLSNSILSTILLKRLFGKLNESTREKYSDSLTKISNRAKYDADVSTLNFDGVVIIDVDKFKFINDNYGYPEGDKILVLVAKVLDEICSKSEETLSCYRYGGDEFIILTSGCTSDYVKGQLLLIKENFSKIQEVKKVLDYEVTLSMGYAYNSINQSLCFNWANHYLHEGKRNGRNGLVCGECGKEPVEVQEEHRKYE